jgi:hypothetical protein
MITDRVGDFIIRLKNAGAIGNQVVSVPHSKHLEAIANKLKELGFVERVEMSKKDARTMEVTLIFLSQVVVCMFPLTKLIQLKMVLVHKFFLHQKEFFQTRRPARFALAERLFSRSGKHIRSIPSYYDPS